ncbi:unnamed protein product [Spirodela intermedia]|uniref:Putative zinc-finger domain-containing protein n=1 Tax=Spirodela intermedia TaxID=51605 RepID=A0A7I8JZW5_SPIIN|nr:unnamed protein product [Spirodela intermedia]
MAEIEELRAKAIASMNASGNSKSKPKGKPTELGKEGEVPSDEDVLCCSGALSIIDTSVKATHPSLKGRQRKRLRSGTGITSLADAQQGTTLENHNKNSQLRNKSLNPTLHGRSSSNDNLIISFSDGDDTDSNPEDSISQRKVNVKGNKEEVDRFRKPLQASHLQPQILQRGIDYRRKIVPMKTSIGHPSSSLFTKAHGPYSRILGPSDGPTVENQTPVQRDDFTNKILSHKEIGHVSDVNVADDKVRSLREQIAVRENVLRLQKMSSPEIKDVIALSDGLCSDSSLKLEAKGPTMTNPFGSSINKEDKRLKHDEQSSTKVRSDHLSPAQHPLRKSTAQTDGQPLETSCHLGVMNMIGSRQLADGPALDENNAVDERYGGINENFCVSSGIHQSQMEDKEPSMASNLAGGTLCNNQALSSQKEVSLDSFNVINFNNPYQLMSQEQSKTDREGILHLEELHDKELEEAQEFRRQCELKEMHALKTYRKAREALIAANNRCSFLYKKREMLSAIASKWSSLSQCENPDNIKFSDDENVFVDSEACFPIADESHDVGVKTSRDNSFKRTSPVQHVEDCELEAYLRTKLVAKLGTKSSLKSASKSYNTDGTVAKPIETVAGDEKSSAHLQMIADVPSQLLQERQKIVEGSEIPGRYCNQVTERIIQSDVDDLCLKDISISINPEDDSSYPKVDRSLSQVAVFSVPSVLQIVCNHFKLLPPELSISHKDLTDVRAKHNMLLSSLPIMGSHNVDFSLDLFWPLCMFELRGKCNDDECPWQHLKGQNRQKTNPVVSANLSSANQVDSSQSLGKVNGVHGFPRRLRYNTLPIPTYHIGTYLIEADTLLSQSVLASCTQQYWDIAFCASLSLPLSVRRVLPSYIPFSCAGDVHPANEDNWNRPSLYFSCEADTTKKLKQGLSDPEQTLEMALDLLNKKMSSMPLKKKALSLLARALEADPNSTILWIVYLHIYYRKEKSVGKDDMFSYAVFWILLFSIILWEP